MRPQLNTVMHSKKKLQNQELLAIFNESQEVEGPSLSHGYASPCTEKFEPHMQDASEIQNITYHSRLIQIIPHASNYITIYTFFNLNRSTMYGTYIYVDRKETRFSI
jgi:hypothetical protein